MSVSMHAIVKLLCTYRVNDILQIEGIVVNWTTVAHYASCFLLFCK